MYFNKGQKLTPSGLGACDINPFERKIPHLL